jgi:hypothetical protein
MLMSALCEYREATEWAAWLLWLLHPSLYPRFQGLATQPTQRAQN